MRSIFVVLLLFLMSIAISHAEKQKLRLYNVDHLVPSAAQDQVEAISPPRYFHRQHPADRILLPQSLEQERRVLNDMDSKAEGNFENSMRKSEHVHRIAPVHFAENGETREAKNNAEKQSQLYEQKHGHKLIEDDERSFEPLKPFQFVHGRNNFDRINSNDGYKNARTVLNSRDSNHISNVKSSLTEQQPLRNGQRNKNKHRFIHNISGKSDISDNNFKNQKQSFRQNFAKYEKNENNPGQEINDLEDDDFSTKTREDYLALSKQAQNREKLNGKRANVTTTKSTGTTTTQSSIKLITPKSNMTAKTESKLNPVVLNSQITDLRKTLMEALAGIKNLLSYIDANHKHETTSS